jgi:hypothetical protein
MVAPIPQDDFCPFDFSSEILCGFDFGAEFNFGRELFFVGDGASTGSWSFGSFEYNGVSIHYSSDETNWHWHRRSSHRRQRPNCMYHI